ncbi:hypothetical protein RR48_12699 [Papilio machaon]|uniref:Uncharacterized protein n=1 Tax=Papilio machaon TaxID=76193 RepID=A0A194QQT5_PAPMA|nr:hypothetical protein RR48_12699 [Papilio machaon]
MHSEGERVECEECLRCGGARRAAVGRASPLRGRTTRHTQNLTVSPQVTIILTPKQVSSIYHSAYRFAVSHVAHTSLLCRVG